MVLRAISYLSCCDKTLLDKRAKTTKNYKYNKILKWEREIETTGTVVQLNAGASTREGMVCWLGVHSMGP